MHVEIWINTFSLLRLNFSNFFETLFDVTSSSSTLMSMSTTTSSSTRQRRSSIPLPSFQSFQKGFLPLLIHFVPFVLFRFVLFFSDLSDLSRRRRRRRHRHRCRKCARDWRQINTSIGRKIQWRWWWKLKLADFEDKRLERGRLLVAKIPMKSSRKNIR